jgi:hypothetical protein
MQANRNGGGSRAAITSIEPKEAEWLDTMDGVHDAADEVAGAWEAVTNAVGIAGAPWWPKDRPSIAQACEQLLFAERTAHERIRWALAELEGGA